MKQTHICPEPARSAVVYIIPRAIINIKSLSEDGELNCNHVSKYSDSMDKLIHCGRNHTIALN